MQPRVPVHKVFQYEQMRVQQDAFINTSASKPKPMKPFDGLEHIYTPVEHLKQKAARLTFAIANNLGKML